MKNIFQYITSKRALAILLVIATFASCEKELEDELLSDTSVDFLYSFKYITVGDTGRDHHL